jgi:hypothetical protein
MIEVGRQEQHQRSEHRRDVVVAAVGLLQAQGAGVGLGPVEVEVEHRREHARVVVAETVAVAAVSNMCAWKVAWGSLVS